jgi:hypothetical protein
MNKFSQQGSDSGSGKPNDDDETNIEESTTLMKNKSIRKQKKNKPKEGGTYCGIKVQPGISRLNLLAIPYIMALTTAGVIFCATRILFMLRDKDYFAVPFT